MRSFTYEGRHYRLQEMAADLDWRTHAPVQKPRIPIWVVGGPKQSQIQRSARWDGAVISSASPETLQPQELHERKVAIEALRANPSPFDIITEGETPPDDLVRASAIVRPFAEAGATWWLESMWELEGVTRDYDMRTRIHSGPPRIS